MGIGETRIAAAAGLSAVIARISEGLQGASLNTGNYNAARRLDADTTFRNLWNNACGSLAHLVDVPDGAELWYDETSLPFLQEDAKDAAEILQVQGNTIATLVSQGGFKPDSVVEAIAAGDITRLVHSGKLSVQLQPIDEDPTPDPEEGAA
jgi:hypothetical protein